MNPLSALLLAPIVAGALASGPAAARTPDGVAAALACRPIADDAARLACLDAAVALLAGDATAQTAAAPPQPAPPPVAEAPPVAAAEAFGAEDLRERRHAENDGEIREITASVVESGVNPYGKIFVVLDNGQVWRQLDSDSTMVRIPKKMSPTVVVKKGGIGGYRMTINELKRTIRVRRVQ